MTVKTIGFWGYPNPKITQDIKNKYPNAGWIDLDIDFKYPKTSVLPESYCKIIRNIIDNTIYLKPDLVIAPIGKDKCDSGWFASKVLSDMGFNVVESFFEELSPKREIKICNSCLPLYEKVTRIMDSVIDPSLLERDFISDNSDNNGVKKIQTSFIPGFWGVPPNDLEILRIFPDSTHVYGWIRCVEAGTPADVDLEMYVNPDIPTVFYSQAFCSKAQLAKYLADKYNGLYIDIDDYASSSVKAKIEAFLRLR